MTEEQQPQRQQREERRGAKTSADAAAVAVRASTTPSSSSSTVPLPTLKVPLPPLPEKQPLVTMRTNTFNGKVRRVYEEQSKQHWKESSSNPQPWKRKKLTIETITGHSFSISPWLPQERPIYEMPEVTVDESRIEFRDERSQIYAGRLEKLRNLETHLLLAKQRLRELKRLPPISDEEMKKGIAHFVKRSSRGPKDGGSTPGTPGTPRRSSHDGGRPTKQLRRADPSSTPGTPKAPKTPTSSSLLRTPSSLSKGGLTSKSKSKGERTKLSAAASQPEQKQSDVPSKATTEAASEKTAHSLSQNNRDELTNTNNVKPDVGNTPEEDGNTPTPQTLSRALMAEAQELDSNSE